jgi:hypothetical protein
MEAARIKFTPALVREVGERVKRITDGVIALGVTGTHPEHGSSYSDGTEQLTWYGPKGAREACAYYTAAGIAWLHETGVVPEGDDGDFLLAVQVAYGHRFGATRSDVESFERWETRGMERARDLAATGK